MSIVQCWVRCLVFKSKLEGKNDFPPRKKCYEYATFSIPNIIRGILHSNTILLTTMFNLFC